MIFIIADDLTGANDTGVQFAKNGYKTSVLILDEKLKSMKSKNIHDVLVIDTETREVEENVARDKLARMLKEINLRVGENNIIYKKIDSTLRGNVGAEIEEILKNFKKKFCLLSPSFPPHQRVTIGGNLIVEDNPLGFSPYIAGNNHNIAESFIPSIIEKQTKLPIGSIDISEIQKGKTTIIDLIANLTNEGKKIIVADSSNEKHLKDIISSGMSFGSKVLFAGSAGLANCLAESYKKTTKPKINVRDNKSPMLIVGGSRNPIMVDQIRHLKDNLDFNELKIDIKEIYTHKDKKLHQYTEESLEILKKNHDLIIYTDAPNNEQKAIDNELMKKYKLSYRELENNIKEFLGILTSNIVKSANIRNLILTGGDIAISACRELGISKLELLGELLPGIPLTSARYDDNFLNIITKAGGFGKKGTMYDLIKKFQNC